MGIAERFGWTPLDRAIVAKRNAIIVHLVEQGVPRKDVAQRLGVSAATVAQAIARRRQIDTVRRLRSIDEGDHA